MPSHRWPMAAYLLVAVACALVMAGTVRAQPLGNGFIGDPGRALGAVAAGVTLAPGLHDLPGVPGSELAVTGVDLTPSTGTAARPQPTDAAARAVVRRPVGSASGSSRAVRSEPASHATTVEGRSREPATVPPRSTAPEESARTTQPTPDATAKPGKARHAKARHARHAKARHGATAARHGKKAHVREHARPGRGRR